MSYVFDHWELDGVDIGSSNPVDITMNSNHTLVAVFKPAPVLNVGVNVNGAPNIANSPTLNNPTISFS